MYTVVGVAIRCSYIFQVYFMVEQESSH
jgi:hypothetical protein